MTFGYNCQGAKLRNLRSERHWMGRIDKSLRNLKVSHSQVRIQIGMLRESLTSHTWTIAQLRADVHDLERTVKRNG